MKPDTDTIRIFFIYAVTGLLISMIVFLNILFSKPHARIEFSRMDELSYKINELEKEVSSLKPKTIPENKKYNSYHRRTTQRPQILGGWEK